MSLWSRSWLTCRTLRESSQSSVNQHETEIKLQRMQLVEYEERLRVLQKTPSGTAPQSGQCLLCTNYEQQVLHCRQSSVT